MRCLLLVVALLSACDGSTTDSADAARGGVRGDGAPYGTMTDGREIVCCNVTDPAPAGGCWAVGTNDDGTCIELCDSRPKGTVCTGVNGCPVIEGPYSYATRCR